MNKCNIGAKLNAQLIDKKLIFLCNSKQKYLHDDIEAMVSIDVVVEGEASNLRGGNDDAEPRLAGGGDVVVHRRIRKFSW